MDYFNGGSTEHSDQPTLLLKHARRIIHRLLHHILIFPPGFQWNQLNINLLIKVQSDRIKGKSLFIFIFWKKYCFFQKGKNKKPSYYWRYLHVTFALTLYYFSSRLCYNILWIKSLHLLSSFFSEWIFYLIIGNDRLALSKLCILRVSSRPEFPFFITFARTHRP